MLYYLSQGEWVQLFSPFNVFQYVTFRAMGAALTAFVISLIVGPFFIRILRRLKLGQPLRYSAEHKELANLHDSKKGTPTMGGIILLVSLTVSVLLWGRWNNDYIWVALLSTLAFGGLGLIDDLRKIRRKGGITSAQKFTGQILIGFIVSVFFLTHEYPDKAHAATIHVPFFKESFIPYLGWWVLPFLLVVMVGSSNAVNLTDGLDGLAIGCTISVSLVYAIFAYLTGYAEFANRLLLPFVFGVSELAVFCAALAGASFGFLWFNCHPAQVFMGDTGSLAIGGSLAVVAIAVNQELLLVIVGGIFVLEALSVILQVASFKMTGKRIFAMSPLHHHFELKGWRETQVVVRFWILSAIFALMGLATLKLR